MQQLTNSPVTFVILILAIVAIILSIYSLLLIRQLSKLKSLFFSGTRAGNLETVIEGLQLNQQTLSEEQSHTAAQVAQLFEQTSYAIQKVGLVRFNPFDDGGGNFSFSLALLDNRNNGVIITSMYGRQQNRIYSKKINAGVSESALTKEEQQAITEANLQ